MKLIDLTNMPADVEALEKAYLDTIVALQRANARSAGAFKALHEHASRLQVANDALAAKLAAHEAANAPLSSEPTQA